MLSTECMLVDLFIAEELARSVMTLKIMVLAISNRSLVKQGTSGEH